MPTNNIEAYAMRSKTKKELIQRIETEKTKDNFYEEPKKVVFEYADSFDLLNECLNATAVAYFE